MAEAIRECVSGVVESVVYRNERNDYSVIEMTGDDGSMITATGVLPYVAEGEEVILYGHWVTHAVYGRQFTVETFEKRLPSDVHAILRYLASGAVRGVGPSTATKIVSRFGEDSFDVIENHPEWLSDIPGVSAKKAAAISEAFREQTGVRAVMMFCRDFVGAAAATRVYKRFGAGAVGKIRENPYCLCDGTLGIGFEKADEIAASLGVEKTAACRLQSGLRYVLQYNGIANGHACLPQDKLAASTAALLGVEEEAVAAALDEALALGKLTSYSVEEKEPPFVFLNETASAEEYVAKKLLVLDRFCATYSFEDAERMIAMVESEQGIQYAALQRRAIHAAMTGGVLIVTGGPGTGKTTVIKALLRIFEHLGCRVALAAPTGRAAKRMSEAGGCEARTIHRMLEMERTAEEGEPRFNRNSQNPLDEDVIIIDEASMLDLPLAAGLLRATRNGTRLILIGDVDQLPSVGTGNVLSDLLCCETFSCVRLHEIFRQSEKSLIVTNAHRINRGEMPRLDVADNDFFFVERNAEGQIAPTVADLLENRLPRAYGEAIRDRIQVITPSRKGRAGTEVLNRLLQDRINPAEVGKEEIRFRDTTFRVGDRVMQIRNNYEITWEKGGKEGSGIFNGDIGVIEEIEKKSETLIIRYDDRVATYDFSLLEELEHAYAITVHKSQGSEYPVVILPLYACAPPLLTRNLIYTAITRAREKVVLVGRRDIAARMVENDRLDMRYTCLSHRILEAAREYEPHI